jgi:hypothetical protein
LATAAAPTRWEISFSPGADPGTTVVREVMSMPGGLIARAALAAVGKPPAQEVRANLTRLKELLETGHVTTTDYAVAGKFTRWRDFVRTRNFWTLHPVALRGQPTRRLPMKAYVAALVGASLLGGATLSNAQAPRDRYEWDRSPVVRGQLSANPSQARGKQRAASTKAMRSKSAKTAKRPAARQPTTVGRGGSAPKMQPQQPK